MKAYTKDGRLFKYIVNAIGGIAEEATFTATPEGITTRAFDPSHFCLVDLNLPKNVFDEYFCASPESFGLNLTEVKNLLSGSTQGEPLEIDYSPDTGKIRFQFKNVNKRTFVTGITKPDKPIQKPPIKFTTKVMVGSKAFKSLISDVKKVVSNDKFTSVEKVLTLTVEPKRILTKASNPISSVEVEKPVVEGGEVMSIETQETVVSTYNIEYLDSIVSSSSEVSELLTLELSKDMPIRVSAVLPSGSLEFYMAPRVPQKN